MTVPQPKVSIVAFSLGVVLGAFLSMLLTILLSVAIVIISFPDNILNLFSSHLFSGFLLLISLLFDVLGGFLAAVLAKGSEVRTAIIVSFIGLVIGALFCLRYPFFFHWANIVAFLLTVPLAWFGGWMAARYNASKPRYISSALQTMHLSEF